jgi:hypothetical protein
MPSPHDLETVYAEPPVDTAAEQRLRLWINTHSQSQHATRQQGLRRAAAILASAAAVIAITTLTVVLGSRSPSRSTISPATAQSRSSAAPSSTDVPGPGVTYRSLPPVSVLPISGTPVASAAAAIAVVMRGLSVEAPTASAQNLSAKLTTLADLLGPNGPGRGKDPAPPFADTSRPVWAVTIAAPFRPQFSKGETFDWGVIVVDQATGAPVAAFARNGQIPALLAK